MGHAASAKSRRSSSALIAVTCSSSEASRSSRASISAVNAALRRARASARAVAPMYSGAGFDQRPRNGPRDQLPSVHAAAPPAPAACRAWATAAVPTGLDAIGTNPARRVGTVPPGSPEAITPGGTATQVSSVSGSSRLPVGLTRASRRPDASNAASRPARRSPSIPGAKSTHAQRGAHPSGRTSGRPGRAGGASSVSASTRRSCRSPSSRRSCVV